MQAFLAGDTARRDEAKLSQPGQELRISTIMIVLTCRADPLESARQSGLLELAKGFEPPTL
jgi:hypothetical protein